MLKSGEVERWGMFELALKGPTEGNPFLDVNFHAVFRKADRFVYAEGFYDGDGVYRIRFMPDEEGSWSFLTESNRVELSGISGDFFCTTALAGNHGPVQVNNTLHFGYEDGTHFIPVGTTCLLWHLQAEPLWQQTLQTLSQSPFNKIRMCVFPIYEEYNQREPDQYPFEQAPEGGFDYTRFNPGYFANLERSIHELAGLGIQADLILFHPYDKGDWGFASMEQEADERYLRYVIARLAAFRNVWWSLANEFDLLEKKVEQWDHYFRLIQEYDSGQHLRSIHNSGSFYDFGKPWITHASIQYEAIRIVSDCSQDYEKPVIIDDCGNDGNLSTRWGSLTPQELVCRIWEGYARGGYVAHGETYWHPDESIWRFQGGILQGESVPRIAFLRDLLLDAPQQLTYSRERHDASTLEAKGAYYLQYFGPHRFAFREFSLPEGSYEVDLIDTWNMTITHFAGTFEGRFRIDMPLRLYLALRIRKGG